MMKKAPGFQSLVFAVLALFVAGCNTTVQGREFNGLETPEGPAIAHQSTHIWALHLFGGRIPMIGDATIPNVVEEFTEEAKRAGASRVRIVRSNQYPVWFAFPPISFLVTPVVTTVAGDVYR